MFTVVITLAYLLICLFANTYKYSISVNTMIKQQNIQILIKF